MRSLRVRYFLLLFLFLASAFVVWGNFSSGPNKKINLGLDLRGGVSITMSINRTEYIHEKLRRLVSEILEFAKEKGIKIKKIGIDDSNQIISISLEQSEENNIAVIRDFFKTSDEIVFDSIDQKRAYMQLSYSERYLNEINKKLLEDSINNLRRRVDEFGVRETLIYSLGGDRIAIEVPGLNDPEELVTLLGKTAKLSFHMVVNDTSTILGKFFLKDKFGRSLPLERTSSLTGDLLDDASVAFSQRGAPVVRFKFNAYGTKKLDQLSRANVGRAMAIVLDDVVLTAPIIRDPIINGRGEISGNFNVKEAKELALLLKSGSLPAELTVIEQRAIGPSLGAEAILLGKRASVLAILLVVAFMLFAYGWYGVAATIALIVNLTLLVASLTLLEATLTLPGIAGLILTIGMAVDANVLIFERMREEFKRTGVLRNSFMNGFENAKATIFDANITTMLAALMMIFVGSGPIRSFAVTLSLGIITSVFSSIFVTRVLLEAFMVFKKPSKSNYGGSP
ncbi:protein translocase subunit SecD [Neorickettsia findlayensis]|uniref:Protein translocase subunit SecD n=1 Tax=Neorickettsia findlayensis TaxID=2686014 RepID=A0A6P1GBX0_9RICK|nr:protein translocase subunit SecD [Neorickettsia findlayensis]QHD65311.1 protein translocase subunit SecD [Neorickettsia findlayensis]